jgi:hypothetical protein
VEWPSRDYASTARFVLDDTQEEKIWKPVGRQGLEAQETLASAKSQVALLLEKIERAEKLVAFGLPSALGVSTLFVFESFFVVAGFCDRAIVHILGAREDLQEEAGLPAGGTWV